MAAEGRDARRLEAGGTAADDQHAARVSGRVDQLLGERALEADGRVDDAAHPAAGRDAARHAWLQAMHGRTSAARPSRVLRTTSGSAIRARTIETMSAMPSSITRSASSSVRKRPVTMVGTDAAAVSCAVDGSS